MTTSPKKAATPSSTATVPPATELPAPSNASLAKATGVALLIAIVLLVVVVLPAEYNLDPTGIGRAIGLTRLSAPVEPAVSTATPETSETPPEPGVREGRVVVKVPAGVGVEHKFSLRKGDKMKYAWSTPGAPLFFDFHGEPEGDTTGFFESYVVSTSKSMKGTFTAPFDGVHGWYWKNKSPSEAEVTLETSGTYDVVGLR